MIAHVTCGAYVFKAGRGYLAGDQEVVARLGIVDALLGLVELLMQRGYPGFHFRYFFVVLGGDRFELL